MTKRFSLVLFYLELICSLVSLGDINFVWPKVGGASLSASPSECIDENFLYHVTKHKEFVDSESTLFSSIVEV